MSVQAFFSAGFRSFFLLAALNAVASIATWVAYLTSIAIGTQGWPPQVLHAHEMIHGTVVAAIAGFLLTAVPNWCGSPPPRPRLVGALLGLWIAGRLALVLGDLVPREVVALVDCAFLPVLAVVLGWPIVRSGKPRNLPVVGLLLVLTLGNVAMHAGLIGANAAWIRAGVYGSVYAAVMMILVIGGRVVPLFTRNALSRLDPDVELESLRWLGGLAIAVALLALGLDLWRPASVASGVAALFAALLLLARQWRWLPGRTLDHPILWILHVGHAWIALGFACHAAAALLGFFPGASALHAFTAGAMGAMILGMMTRVALGHTGRPIEASGFMAIAFLAVVLGAFVRVFAPIVAPTYYLGGLWLSGVAFAAAYLIFVIEFAPIVWAPRIDAG